jgi:hypothetical protein
MSPRGPVDRLSEALGAAAATLRRRREERGPRARLYDERGGMQIVDPASPEGERLLSAAAAMIDAVDVGRREAAERAEPPPHGTPRAG